MSTPQKRAPRPVRPKVNNATSSQPAEPALAVAPPVTPAAAPSSPANENVEAAPSPQEPTSPAAAPQKTRVQTNKAIGVNISAARARRHIDKLNLNAVLDKLIGELKSQLAPYKTAKTRLESGKAPHWVEKEVEGKKVRVEEMFPLTDAERTAAQKVVTDFEAAEAPAKSLAYTLEAKVAALSRERTRFSNEASIVLSIICDELVQQLVEHTMNRVLAAKKKIIQISHLHESGVESLSLYPLIKSLPSFTATASKLANELRLEGAKSTLAAALAQAEKEFKKKYNVHVPKKRKDVPNAVETPAAEPVAEPAAEEAHDAENDEEDAADSKTSFKFYVHQVCKELVKKDAKYKAVRVSTEIRGYLSDLLIEFIQRISPLVLLTANSMKNKTVNDVAILRTVESLLIDGHSAVETVELQPAKIPDPAVVKAELAKRDEEKKAGREYKINLEAVPKVDGFVAHRSIAFMNSGYSALAVKVNEKLAIYNALPQKEKAAVVAAVEAELTAA